MTKTYFVTASAYMHQNLFQRAEAAHLLIATIIRNRDRGEFLLHEFVIMPNHIHLLISVDDDHFIGRAMQMIKGGFSHAMGQAGLKLSRYGNPAITNTASEMMLNTIACGPTFTRIQFAEIWSTPPSTIRIHQRKRRSIWMKYPGR